MSHRTSAALAIVLIVGALGAGTLCIVGAVNHLGCGPKLTYDYDTGACESPETHPTSKGILGTVVAGVAAIVLGSTGVALLWRNKGLR